MADRTAIEWTDATWTPIRARNKVTGKVGWHCEHASPGCANCYSESFNEKRLGAGLPFKPGHRSDVEHFLDEAMLLQPLRWRRPRKIFVCSMTDLFGEWVPDAWIDSVFAVMALAPRHTFQVLTKRSARMRAYIRDLPGRATLFDAVFDLTRRMYSSDVERDGQVGAAALLRLRASNPLPNVWLGVSAEDQRRADERVPDLLATPAAVRFVSAEPLLGPIDLTAIACPNGCHPPEYCNRCHPDGGEARGTFDALATGELDLIIVGGENGPRATHPTWVREIRDQCATYKTSFFFKQWGTWQPRAWCQDGGTHAMNAFGGQISFQAIQSHPNSIERVGAGDEWSAFARVGKKAAGRLLDGVEHNGMPAIAGGRA